MAQAKEQQNEYVELVHRDRPDRKIVCRPEDAGRFKSDGWYDPQERRAQQEELEHKQAEAAQKVTANQDTQQPASQPATSTTQAPATAKTTPGA